MKLSIFTPTNNPSKIHLPYNSILEQKKKNPNLNIEWVIIPNDDAIIPSKISKEEWVKIFYAPLGMKNVGALKRFACEKATGDAFVELDHDDELLPGSLEEYTYHLTNIKTDNVFLYSDKIVTRHDGKPHLYGSAYGWEHYDWKGHRVNKSFLPDARSLSEIYFAPDHIRIWSRRSYELSGGHDANLFVGDDHDLVIRTYLAGSAFIFMEKPTYNYYVHGDNTWLRNNNAVQVQQRANRDKHLHSLVKEWCRRKKLKSINYPSQEFNNLIGQENSVGCIKLSNTLGLLSAGEEVIDFFNKAYHMLVPGGWLLTDTVSTEGKGAWSNPMNKSFWNELTFRYFTNRDFAKDLPNYKGRFQTVVSHTHFPDKWHEDNKIPYVRVDMCALKGQRAPGWQYI
jgi:hypothetical protein